MDSVYLTLRVLLSLAVVVAMLWALAHVLRGRAVDSGRIGMSVVSRIPVGRRSAVALVRLEGQGYLLGVTDEHVSLLAVTDLPELPEPEPERTAVDLRSNAPLHSLDATARLRHAVDVLRERTARR
jgi:flagellar protein FliO/FliZ